MSAFAAATQSGDRNSLKQLLASDVRIVTDAGGKVRAALDVVEGADRAAQFLVDVTRKRPGAWWRDDFRARFAIINGLPGIIVDAPEGPGKPRHSSLRVTSYRRCTLCAIRTSYATWRRREMRKVSNERAFVDSNCGSASHQ